MNKIFLKGRIGKSELKHSKTGTVFCNFSLATSEGKKNADGTWENETEWHNCVAFGKTAELVDWIGKGGNAVVIGKIKTESYEKDGQKKYVTKIICDHVEGWVSPVKGQESQDQQVASGQQTSFTSEDIPFAQSELEYR